MKEGEYHQHCDAFVPSDRVLICQNPTESCTGSEDVIHYGGRSPAEAACPYTPNLSLPPARSQHWYDRYSPNLRTTEWRSCTSDSSEIQDMHAQKLISTELFEFQRIRFWHVVGKGLELARDLEASSEPQGLYGDSLKWTIIVWGDIAIATCVHHSEHRYRGNVRINPLFTK